MSSKCEYVWCFISLFWGISVTNVIEIYSKSLIFVSGHFYSFRWVVMARIGALWWHHQMERFSALLALCVGNSQVTCGFPSQRPVTQSFDVFFDLCLNKWLNKQLERRQFETPSHPLWCHCNVIKICHKMNSAQSRSIFGNEACFVALAGVTTPVPYHKIKSTTPLNRLRPSQNGCKFPDIFKCIFLNENV